MMAAMIFPLIGCGTLMILAALLFRDGAKMRDALRGQSPLAMRPAEPVMVRVRWATKEAAPALTFNAGQRAAA